MGCLSSSRSDSALDRLSTGLKATRNQSWVILCVCTGLMLMSVMIFFLLETAPEVSDSKRAQLRVSLDAPHQVEFISLQSSLRRTTPPSSRSSMAQFDDGMKNMANSNLTALHGLGSLLRKGTRAMEEMIVAHVTESTSSDELQMFLRTLHRSGATAKADLVLLFPFSPLPSSMLDIIEEEEESFRRLIATVVDPSAVVQTQPASSLPQPTTLSPFNTMSFKLAALEPHLDDEIMVWGKYSNILEDSAPDWAAWGSIVAFDMQELDPHNSLEGFFDTPPAQLRRWVCYDMLLGMVKSKFQNVLLTPVQGVLVLGDALASVRKKQTLYLTAEDQTWSTAEKEPVMDARAMELQGSQNGDSLTSTIAVLKGVKGGAWKGKRRQLLMDKRRRKFASLEDKDQGDEGDEIQSELEEVAADSQVEEDTLESVEMEAVEADPTSLSGVKKKASMWRQAGGLMQSVYGLQLWHTLDAEDRKKLVVNSEVVMGALPYVRGLANKMSTEIVRVAVERRSRRTFHDKAIMNLLVHKSSVLGKRVLGHLKLVQNQESSVHSLLGSQQPHIFWRQKAGGAPYAIIQGYTRSNFKKSGLTSGGNNIMCDVHHSICQSSQASQLYQDCVRADF
ncbi:unnamed protein product [Sphagnum compactum]